MRRRKGQIKKHLKSKFETYEEFKLRVHFWLDKVIDEEIRYARLSGRSGLKVVYFVGSQKAKGRRE